MKKIFLSLLLLLLTAATGAWAQSNNSHWPEFSSSNFEDGASLYASIKINGKIITADEDNWNQLEVAAFVDDRGVEVCVSANNYLYNGYVENFGDPFPVLNAITIYYNEPGDKLYFKMYNHATGIEYNACTVTCGGNDISIFTSEEHWEGFDDPNNPIFLNFTMPDKYSVKMKEGTKDAGNWTISTGSGDNVRTVTGSDADGLKDLSEGDAVTLTYGGHLKVKSVTATHDGEIIDDATVEITTSDINEGDPSVVFNVKLSKAPLCNAKVLVKVGETTHEVPVDATGKGSLTLANPNGEDVYLDASSITAKVVGVTGGNYGNIVTGQTATANIYDTVDDTIVEITTSDISEGDASVVFYVQLSNAPQGNAMVQVKVGEETKDVAVNATGAGTLTISNPHTSSVTAEVVGVIGGNYERVVTGQSATAQIIPSSARRRFDAPLANE